jgi:CheY-like chemotaxis protein
LKSQAVEILLVEDNPGDVRLMVEALKETRIPSRLHLAEDGVQAMSFLRRKGAHVKAPRPDLVLLDLNLPKKDGREVLAEIKDDPKLRSIPVVVLTTSQSESDVVRSYELHANCYISKPVGLENFIRVIQSIEGFWLETVRLPER